MKKEKRQTYPCPPYPQINERKVGLISDILWLLHSLFFSTITTATLVTAMLHPPSLQLARRHHIRLLLRFLSWRRYCLSAISCRCGYEER